MATYLDETALYLWGEGTNAYAYRDLGCHRVILDGYEVFRFAVWAPNAYAVSVVGDFNGWNTTADPMHPCGSSGVWECHIGIVHPGDVYKFAIQCEDGRLLYKADPFAFFSECRPGTASIVWEIDDYPWQDRAHMQRRRERKPAEEPMSIYEVHLGSWKQGLGYAALAEQLVCYCVQMGYTHIELMPLSEYPLDDSWGYQVTGYYAITSRYGTPQDFQYFVDCAHKAGLSVILDWVPAHFTKDDHGLRAFDGTPLFEHPDPRRSEQPQWGTLLFDYGRTQVQSFLISNAVFLFQEYHIDALRVDAVSCMLYLDYGRDDGNWLPNQYGGRENLHAIAFLQKLSATVARECPGALLIAEESTAFPYVTRRPEEGGLGFDFKWNMGWMNDTLRYMATDSLYRRYHHDKLTFSMCYAFAEQHILPFSHDEVVHGKRSLMGRMPGSYADGFRQLRLLFMYQFAHPGKKLCFMGCEFGQFIEWNFRSSLDWLLLSYPAHSDLQCFIRELNCFYAKTPALWALDQSWAGFQWLCVDDAQNSVLAFLRVDRAGNELLCAFNFSGVDLPVYRVPMPHPARLSRILSSVDFRELKDLQTEEDKAGYYVELSFSSFEAGYYSIE